MEQITRTENQASPSFSNPNPSILLRRRILSWSKENRRQASSVQVHVDGKIFHLHKPPLASKSGFFRKALSESSEIRFPGDFPGGLDAFEMAMLFIYGSPLPLDPFNVLPIHCAAFFLEMTEEYSSGSLCEQADLYLNQVVLQSWDDTLIVLQKCQILQPWAEELLITRRCIESLAFMACMEILDPECERELPLLSLQAMAGHAWSCEEAKKIVGRDLWVKELVALPFNYFDRIIRSLRSQGMEEKYVSPIIVLYAIKWVLSEKTSKYLEEEVEDGDNRGAADVAKRVPAILRGLIELLPLGEDKAAKVIPVGFHFAMLSRSISLGLSEESRAQLEEEAASLLHFARVEDFLLPVLNSSIASSDELKVMERIFSFHQSFKHNKITFHQSSHTDSMVAELWDRYLSSIAVDPTLEVQRFISLIETVPTADRDSHDHLYKAISVFLLKHPHITREEKASVCKHLDCHRFSQPVCIQAVQNQRMPLRLIVQALSVQQLQTQQAFRDFSESFRCSQYGDFFSESLLSSRSQALPSLYQQQINDEEEEYGSASFQIQALEDELMALKKRMKKSLKEKDLKRSHPALGQVNGCIGSIDWGPAHWKQVRRLLNAFGRLKVVGKGRREKETEAKA